jgi:hypothetical protein
VIVKDDDAEVPNRQLLALALLRTEEEAMFSELLEHLPDNFAVTSEVRMCDEDVVQVDHDISGQNEVLEMSFIIVWKVPGELVRPKYITSGSKSPQFVWNTAFHLSPSRIRTLLKPHQTSSFLKNRAPFKQLIRLLIKGSDVSNRFGVG